MPIIRSALRWMFLASSSIGLLIGLSSFVVIPLLFGSPFRGAVVPLLILLPGQIVADLGKVVSQKLLVDNRPGEVSRALVLAALVSVVALYALVGRHGITGAATATTVSQLVFTAYVMVVATRHLRHRSSGARIR